LPEGSLDENLVNEGLMMASSPGRLETFRRSEAGDEDLVLLDVAHNPDGVSALVKALVEEFTFERVVFVTAILSDKDHEGMLAEMARLESSVVATQARGVRSVSPADLAKDAEELGLSCVTAGDMAGALEIARRDVHAGDLVCVTGSHYAVGEARDILVGGPR
jgi:dihydrofolate synthase/folylpolyglutamate synthase